MKKEYLYGVLGLIGGALIVLIFANRAVNSNNAEMMAMMGMHQQTQNVAQLPKGSHMMGDGQMMMGENDSSMTMNGMVDALKGKTGDEFDKTFIEQMIPHHQGAIDMAKLVEQNAKHQELKDLAKDIISAQTKEINMMKDWQKNWGY